MAIDTGARELTVRATPAPGRVRLSVGGLLRKASREAAIETALGRLPNVRQVRASSLTGNVLLVFDPEAWADGRSRRGSRARAWLRRPGGCQPGVFP